MGFNHLKAIEPLQGDSLLDKNNVTSSFWEIWSGLYFFCYFFFHYHYPLPSMGLRRQNSKIKLRQQNPDKKELKQYVHNV